jgi:hypothetical protein
VLGQYVRQSLTGIRSNLALSWGLSWPSRDRVENVVRSHDKSAASRFRSASEQSVKAPSRCGLQPVDRLRYPYRLSVCPCSVLDRRRIGICRRQPGPKVDCRREHRRLRGSRLASHPQMSINSPKEKLAAASPENQSH